jgi:hypothetical protein
MTCRCLLGCFKAAKQGEEYDLTQPLLDDKFYENGERKALSSNEASRTPPPKTEESTLTSDSTGNLDGMGLGYETFQGGLLRSSFLGIPDEQLSDLHKLEKHCPMTTEAERQRFLNAKGGKYEQAHAQLMNYLEWREEYDLDHMNMLISPSIPSADEDWQSCASSDGTLDEIDWLFASDKALSYDSGHVDSLPATLPQLARILTIPGSDEHLRDRCGNRIILLLPAQMDPSIASDTTFALCVAFYLERKLGRNSMEKLCIAIDVRGGHGWANPKPSKLIPFIKKVTSITERNFPERLSNCVLFPMPRAAAVIWNMVRMFLDPNTAEKMVVVPGNAGTDAAPPFKRMEAHMAREIIDRMETIRLATFTT